MLRQILQEAGLHQKEIARKLGVSESYISKIKHGQIPSEVLVRRMARILSWDKQMLEAILDETTVGRLHRREDRRRLQLATLTDQPVILSADVQCMMRQVEVAREEVQQMSGRLETINQSLQAIAWLLLEALTDRK